MLTHRLATRSGSVLAMDISARALQQARIDQPDNVELRHGSVPADWPPGRFDLVVLSEMGYYLDEQDCRRLAQLAMTSAGDLIAVHWRHPVGDYPLTGDQFHRILDQIAARHGLGPDLQPCRGRFSSGRMESRPSLGRFPHRAAPLVRSRDHAASG